MSKYPKLFAALIDRGWSSADLAKLASTNLIRVFRDVEKVRDSLRWRRPEQGWIPDDDLKASENLCSSPE